MEEKITLSYILTTYNKLKFLKITLPVLINACQNDEEIVIVDGGSTDGTPEYLSQLKKDGKIHQFISEKDFGEAHGTNKAILMAKGEIIKIITDDDVFSFECIASSKKFLLTNKEYDIMGFDGMSTRTTGKKNVFNRHNTAEQFQEWLKDKKPFIFCGLSIIFRKSSLPLLGFFNPAFKIIDFEYTMKVTSLPIKLAWNKHLGYTNIATSASNSVKFNRQLKYEYALVHKMYLKETKTLTTWKTPLVYIKSSLTPTTSAKDTQEKNYDEVFKLAVTELKKRNELIKEGILH